MPETYYRFLDDMVDPASGEIVAEQGDHVKGGGSQVWRRITALIAEYPNQWSITKVANYINIASPVREVVNDDITEVLDRTERALSGRNRGKDQQEVNFWRDFLLHVVVELIHLQMYQGGLGGFPVSRHQGGRKWLE